MTAAHQEHDSPHEGPVKTPKQVILAVLFGFVVPIAVIVLLAIFVASGPQPAAGSNGLSKEAIAERLRPVGHVEVKDASDLASLKTGEQVFAAQCTACHTAGVAGAPKLGDAAAWAPRIGQGYEALLVSALKGKGAMGAQGGGDFSDLEIGRAVVYMANKGGAKFAEPQPPAAGRCRVGSRGACGRWRLGAGGGHARVDHGGSDHGGDRRRARCTRSRRRACRCACDSAAASAASATKSAAATAAPAAAGAAAVAPPLYAQICLGCHAAGIAGAPKVGDKAAWAPRVAQGMDTLYANAIKGKGAMPPRGGASTASDADIKAVVDYMVQASK